PRALRRDDDAEPDDRAVASATRHGVVRAGAHIQVVDRAHDDGHPAVADTAAGVAGGCNADTGADAVAAAGDGVHQVAAAVTSAGGDLPSGSTKPPSATSLANSPFCATSSRNVPRSTMWPPSSTRMVSASATVDRRWAMMKVVRPFRRWS